MKRLLLATLLIVVTGCDHTEEPTIATPRAIFQGSEGGVHLFKIDGHLYASPGGAGGLIHLASCGAVHTR